MTKVFLQVKATLKGTDGESTDPRWYAFADDQRFREWIEGRMEADESVTIEEMAVGCERKGSGE